MTITESKTKVCTSCKKTKQFSKFYNYKKGKNGLKSECKRCADLRVTTYLRTKEGLITKIYANQIISSRCRGHQPPNYTKEQLKEWVFNQSKFDKLHSDWVNSNYDKMLIPSCDRDDDDLGYDLSRLTLTTWEKNNQKGHDDMRSGKLINGSRPQKAIIGTHVITGETIKFHSMNEAARNGFNAGNISSCCSGERKTHKNYKWNYKNNIL